MIVISRYELLFQFANIITLFYNRFDISLCYVHALLLKRQSAVSVAKRCHHDSVAPTRIVPVCEKMRFDSPAPCGATSM